MMCAWKDFLNLLPGWMRSDVDMAGKETLRELRLRVNFPPELISGDGCLWLQRSVTVEDLNYIVNVASRYSPWCAASSSEGFLTAKGGHRIGLCGEAVMKHGMVSSIQNLTSLCIRVARDFPGIGAGIEKMRGSVLILGPPGWGKTTLLRDMIRQIGKKETICVADERGELFPEGLERGRHTDVLSGCPKKKAILMLLKTMGPKWIAVDEITDAEDCEALIQASNCGVHLLASAHASSPSDIYRRSVYRKLLENHIFHVVCILQKDCSYSMERVEKWAASGLGLF